MENLPWLQQGAIVILALAFACIAFHILSLAWRIPNRILAQTEWFQAQTKWYDTQTALMQTVVTAASKEDANPKMPI